MANVTLKQVAEAAGVSVQTASHILNTGYSKPYRLTTRHKVSEVARQLGYRPNAAARSMVNRRTHTVGVIMPAVGGWFAPMDAYETMVGMNLRLAQDGYVTTVIPFEHWREDGGQSRIFRESMLDAVVVVGLAFDEHRQRAEQSAPVCLWCDTNMNEPQGCLRRDEEQAGRLVATQLLDLGYRRLVLVTYAYLRTHYSHGDRLAGIRAVATARGVPLDVVYCTRPEIGAEAATLLDALAPDTGVLAENHHFALAVMNVTRNRRWVPGPDYGLAACDISRERITAWPSLAGALVDRRELGRQLAEMLLRATADGGHLPPSIIVQAEWHPGDTVRRVAP